MSDLWQEIGGTLAGEERFPGVSRDLKKIATGSREKMKEFMCI